MQTYVAEHSEIIRSSQKDEEFLGEFGQMVSELVRQFGGDAQWIRYYRYIQPITKLSCYALASAFDVQTLGEEYLGLIQVRQHHPLKFPLPWQRPLWAIFDSFGALSFQSIIQRMKAADDVYYQKLTTERKVPLGRVILSSLLRGFSFGTIERLHWAIFYLGAANFFDISKRLVGIRYATIRPGTNNRMRTIFQCIGAAYILQYMVTSLLNIRRDMLKNQRIRRNPSDADHAKETNFYCDICLNSDYPVSTPCGHVFCFDCILFHSEHAGLDVAKGQCPQCRYQFDLRKVIPLLNL